MANECKHEAKPLNSVATSEDEHSAINWEENEKTEGKYFPVQTSHLVNKPLI